MSSRSKKTDILGLLGWFLVTFIAAAIGSKASIDATTFYAWLAQPGWAPPSWLFGPVWTVLYTLIAIAAWLAIPATLITLWRVRPLAGALFVPYLIWVSFAAALNFALWRLNPRILG
jgi:tryptophan-rich sensory protein